MARYTGPSTKIARKFGEPIYGADRYLEKRNFPPGQHGLPESALESQLSTAISLKRSRK